MQKTASHALNWDDLKFFLAVARTGTLRGGADSIRVNHSTLARRLTLMEEQVGLLGAGLTILARLSQLEETILGAEETENRLLKNRVAVLEQHIF